jgi:hypothetical protein
VLPGGKAHTSADRQAETLSYAAPSISSECGRSSRCLGTYAGARYLHGPRRTFSTIFAQRFILDFSHNYRDHRGSHPWISNEKAVNLHQASPIVMVGFYFAGNYQGVCMRKACHLTVTLRSRNGWVCRREVEETKTAYIAHKCNLINIFTFIPPLLSAQTACRRHLLPPEMRMRYTYVVSSDGLKNRYTSFAHTHWLPVGLTHSCSILFPR